MKAVAEAPIEAPSKLTRALVIPASIEIAYLPSEVVERRPIVELAGVSGEGQCELIRTLGPNRQRKAGLRRENIRESGHVVSRRDERRTYFWVRLSTSCWTRLTPLAEAPGVEEDRRAGDTRSGAAGAAISDSR